MVNNIIYQGVDCLIRTEDCFHFAEFSLTAVNVILFGILCHPVVFLVDQIDNFLVQFQFHYTALIVDRACCSVFDCLGHIIDVDVITEHFTGASIFLRDWSACKADVCCVGKAVANDTSCTHHDVGLFLSFFVGFCYNSFLEAILPTVCFVSHNNNVSSLGKCCFAFLELLHCREYNTVCLTVIEEFLQMLSTFSVLRSLTEEVLALGKLSEQLIIKIVTVSNNYDSGAVEFLLQQLGIENHRQRFSAALSMPEHTTLAIGGGSSLCGDHSLINCKILMVSGKNFNFSSSVIGEADKIANNIEQSAFFKHALKQGLEVCELCSFVITVHRLPFHETGKRRGDRSCLGCGLIANNAECIICK